MSVLRVAQRKRFTTVERDLVNDSRLSFRARGLLVWLLDKPDGWRVNSSSIAHAATEGRDAVRIALNELEATGYLVRARRQTRTGTWVTETLVKEDPKVDATEAGFPGVGSPAEDGKPGVGEPGVGFPGANTKTENENCNSSTFSETLPLSDTSSLLSPTDAASGADDEKKSLVKTTLAYWIDTCRANGENPTQRRIGRMGAEIKRLVGEGKEERVLIIAVGHMADEGKTPGYIDYAVSEAERYVAKQAKTVTVNGQTYSLEDEQEEYA